MLAASQAKCFHAGRKFCVNSSWILISKVAKNLALCGELNWELLFRKWFPTFAGKWLLYLLLGVAAPENPNEIILCLKLFWCFGLEIHSELLFLWTKLFWWKFPVDVTKERPAYLGIGINWLAGLKWGQFYFESPVVDTREYPETFFGTSQRLEPDYFWKVSFFYFASKTQRRIVVFEFMEITKNA